MSDSIVVVCAADDNYAMPVAVMLRSVLANLSRDRRLIAFIIDGDITQVNKRRVEASLHSEQCEVRWIPKPEALINPQAVQDANLSGGAAHLSIASWYRLVIPDLLPSQFKRAIYLDCDVIVKADLQTLWKIDLKDNYLLAVPRLARIGSYVSSPGALMNWQELGFAPDAKYFNAGVLVFNLEQWQADNLCAKALDYLAHNRQYTRWADQCVLNAIVAGRWGELDPRWNCMEARGLANAEVDEAFILHYTSAAKPWFTPEDYAAKTVFLQYLDMTDWAGYRHSISQRLWRKLKKQTQSRFKVLQLGFQ